LSQQKSIEVQAALLLGMVGQLQIASGAKMLAPLGLNRSKLAVLQYINDHKQVTISEMSNQLEINQPGITKIVQQFLIEGLIKASDTDDKRVKHLSITKKGQTKYGATLDTLLPEIAQPYRDWSKKELQAFVASLDKLKHWLDENKRA
jgi:DNA-binding MarR family transcriptional regulator